MSAYEIEVETEGREVYIVEADSETEAIVAFNRGEHGDPIISEVLSIGYALAAREVTP